MKLTQIVKIRVNLSRVNLMFFGDSYNYSIILNIPVPEKHQI